MRRKGCGGHVRTGLTLSEGIFRELIVVVGKTRRNPEAVRGRCQWRGFSPNGRGNGSR